MTTFRIGAVLALCLLGTACATRPSVGDLSASIQAAASADPAVDITRDQADCIAERLLDSGLSDTTLEGLAENFDEPEVLSAEVERVEPLVAEYAIACMTGG